MMVPVFGNTQSAASLTAAVFMAGLGLGGFWGGKLAALLQSRKQALKKYVVFEAGIGFYAVLFPLWNNAVSWAHLALTPDITVYPMWAGVIRLVFFFFLLLPPTLLMGASFPLLGTAFVKTSCYTGRDTALVYGINTLGGTAGVLGGGFYLIRIMGGYSCLITAGSMSIMLAVMILFTARSVSADTAVPLNDNNKHKPVNNLTGETPNKFIILILSGAGLAGFCALAYEIIWTRLLVIVLQNSVYAFSLILAGFLAGIAIGSLLLVPLCRKLKKPVTLFGIIQILAGTACLAVPHGFELPERPGEISYLSFLLTKPFFMVLAPMIFSGALVPLAADIISSKKKVGRTLGSVYAFNSLGSVLGSLAAGFILIPLTGCRNAVVTLFVLQISAGGLLLALSIRPLKLCITAGFAVTAILILALIQFPKDIVRGYYEKAASSEKLLWLSEGRSATASITVNKAGNRILYLNGIAEVTNDKPALRTFRLMALLPYVIHPAPDNALMITFGAGVSAGLAVHLFPEVSCVEINETCTDIARIFKRENRNVLDADNLKVHITDGRNYLRHSHKKHSVIISDATHPHSYDSWVLFTEEFYRLCIKRLDNDGVFCQWLPLHGLAPEQFRIILNTITDVFPDVTLWSVDNAYCLMLAGKQDVKINPARLAKTLNRKDIRPFLASSGLDNPYRILNYYVTGKNGLEKLLKNETLINTDNHPHNQFFPLSVNGFDRLKWHVENLKQILPYKEKTTVILQDKGK